MHLKAHKVVLVALLLFGFGLLVGTSLGNMVRRHAREQDFAHHTTPEVHSGTTDQEFTNEDFPREVAGMVRTDLLTGAKATEFVSSFLGQDRNVSGAYIGTYKDTDSEVVIFVAKFLTAAEAEEVLSAMKKTLKDKEIFTECFEKYILEDITVNYLLDEKNSHYFYVKGNRIIWVMAGAQEGIQLLMDFYLHF